MGEHRSGDRRSEPRARQAAHREATLVIAGLSLVIGSTWTVIPPEVQAAADGSAPGAVNSRTTLPRLSWARSRWHSRSTCDSAPRNDYYVNNHLRGGKRGRQRSMPMQHSEDRDLCQPRSSHCRLTRIRVPNDAASRPGSVPTPCRDPTSYPRRSVRGRAERARRSAAHRTTGWSSW